MSTKPPSRTAEQFVARLPEGMRDRIAAEAKQNSRSMNAEIVARLESSFAGSSDQSALISVIARLNVELSRAELEQRQTQMKSVLLAHSLMKAAELISVRLGDTDIEALALAHDLKQLAFPILDQQGDLETELANKLMKLMGAIKELKKAGPPTTHVASNFDQDAQPAQPTEPEDKVKRRTPRIVRKVTK